MGPKMRKCENAKKMGPKMGPKMDPKMGPKMGLSLFLLKKTKMGPKLSPKMGSKTEPILDYIFRIFGPIVFAFSDHFFCRGPFSDWDPLFFEPIVFVYVSSILVIPSISRVRLLGWRL